MKKIILLIYLFFSFSYVVFAQSCPSQTTFNTSTAILVGEITNHGGDPNLEIWFRWGEGSVLNNETLHQFINVSYLPYRFCSSISNLKPCTVYSYQAIAKNSGGIQYGEIFTFTTKCSFINPVFNINSGNNKPPVAIINYSPSKISPGTTVNFDASKSYDTDGNILFYIWKINGKLVSYQKSFKRSFPSGNYEIELTVIDNKGASDSTKFILYVGKNVRIVKKEVQTITKKVSVYKSNEEDNVDLVLLSNYSFQKCSDGELKATLVNSTNKKQKVKLSLKGDFLKQYQPYIQFKEFSYEIPANSSKDILIKIPILSSMTGLYNLSFQLNNKNKVKTYNTLVSVHSEPKYASNFFTEPGNSLLASIFDVKINNFLKGFLIFILIALNIYLGYKLKKSKHKEETL